MLTREGCVLRQKRLLARMSENAWDVFVTSNPRTVYYFTGALSVAKPALFLMFCDGASVLVSALKEAPCVDTILTLETYSIHREINEPMHDAVTLLGDEVRRRGTSQIARFAVDRERTTGLLEELMFRLWPDATLVDATSTILRLRRRKERDELQEIRSSLELCAVAYRRAREIIAPGLTEIDVFNALQSAVTSAAGTFVELRGDFACGTRGIKEGGPATRRVLQKGDLYILDIFPEPAFYAGDTCRTFVVGEASDRQMLAWETVRKAQQIAEGMLRPGVRANEVYRAVKEFLDAQEVSQGSFWHHAGHAIGMDGHESPRLIPGADDVLETGDVMAVEPGIYAEALQGGIRLEDNYYLSEDCLENLFSFPLEL